MILMDYEACMHLHIWKIDVLSIFSGDSVLPLKQWLSYISNGTFRNTAALDIMCPINVSPAAFQRWCMSSLSFPWDKNRGRHSTHDISTTMMSLMMFTRLSADFWQLFKIATNMCPKVAAKFNLLTLLKLGSKLKNIQISPFIWKKADLSGLWLPITDYKSNVKLSDTLLYFSHIAFFNDFFWWCLNRLFIEKVPQRITPLSCAGWGCLGKCVGYFG